MACMYCDSPVGELEGTDAPLLLLQKPVWSGIALVQKAKKRSLVRCQTSQRYYSDTEIDSWGSCKITEYLWIHRPIRWTRKWVYLRSFWLILFLTVGSWKDWVSVLFRCAVYCCSEQHIFLFLFLNALFLSLNAPSLVSSRCFLHV